jgi:protein arginine N-methyltransferase 2
MDDPELKSEIDLHTQEILLAASQHDLTTLRDLIRTYSFLDCHAVDVQDSETGFCPLHAAIAACETEENTDVGPNFNTTGDTSTPNGYSADSNGMSPQEELLEGAKQTIKCLQENGAIWNQLDRNNETPGCIALRLGLRELYDMMVDAGVRAEILLNRLEGYERLEDDDEIEETTTQQAVASEGTSHDVIDAESAPQNATDRHVTTHLPSRTPDVDSDRYLSSALSLSGHRILDDQQNAVMMSWESDIMSKSADAILIEPGLKILNIGFGMGIIDTHIQSHPRRPSSHHIIEAHPTVLATMREQGWHAKPGVVVHEGKWQDILPQLASDGQTFDAIYFDTFAESYAQFRDFFSEHVISLLEQSGRWSYFNGMGADRQISYDVYQKVSEMDLFEAGFDVDWEEIEVPTVDWEGVRRSYWNIQKVNSSSHIKLTMAIQVLQGTDRPPPN